MKILHVINSLKFGGAESLLTELLPLINKEADIELLVLDYDEYDEFTLKLLNKGVKLIPLKIKGGVYNPLLIFKITSIIRKYQLVHVHLFPSLYWVALANLFNRTKSTLIFTEHSTNNKRRDKLVFKILDKYIYSQYKTVICISEATRINLCKHLNRTSGIVKIENGINLAAYNNTLPFHRENLNLKDDDVILLQVASFRLAKDQDTVIRAIKLLPDRVKLLFAGEGDRINICKELVSDMSLNHRVHFLGNRSDVPSLLAMCDIVVMSSNYEGFGLAAVEGMASNKPVIASNVEGLSQVVIEAGLLFDKGDETMLAKQIESLINDEQFYSRISCKCKSRAEEYNIDLMVKKYLSLYRSFDFNS